MVHISANQDWSRIRLRFFELKRWRHDIRPNGIRPNGIRPKGIRHKGIQPKGIRPKGIRPNDTGHNRLNSDPYHNDTRHTHKVSLCRVSGFLIVNCMVLC
jgi:hypothetical protein